MGGVRGPHGHEGDLVHLLFSFQSRDSRWFCGFGGWALPWHFALGPQFPQVTGCRCFRTLTQCFDFPGNVLCRAGSPEQCYKS